MQLIDNKYLLSGGVDPIALVAQYGSPLYVYDGAIIERQYDRIQTAFTVNNLRINYACKALTNINILKLLQQKGAGIDCVSIEEVHLAFKAGFSKDDIFYTPSFVDMQEIEQAVALGVHITLDSISLLEEFGQYHSDIAVCIRINPHIMAGFNRNISVGHIDSKFGISFHQMPHVHRIVGITGLTIKGLHMHTGSDILDSQVFLQGAEILFGIAKEFKNLEFLDFGSGFKVAYKPGDASTDIEELGEQISARFNQFCKDYGKDLTLVFEPGKFIVSESGYFLAKVTSIKQTTSTVFAGIDTGLNHLIRPMFYNAYHHIINLSNPAGKQRFYTVVGYICETDTFAINRQIPTIQEGNILAFLNAGAYAFSMASNYNSRLRPAEVLVHQGKDYLIRKRETIEDLLQHQIEVL